MNSDLELRAVGYDDPDAVTLTALAQQFYVATYGGPDETPIVDGEFTPPNGEFLVGSLPGPDGIRRPVVMGGWRFISGPIDGAHRPAELKRMFVRDEVRGQGLARQLLAAVEQSATAAGADQLVLETGSPQVAAIALYRSAGYRDIAPFGHYAASPTVVTLGRTLTPRA